MMLMNPYAVKLESHDFAEDKLYRLNVKYERLPRFCSYCGHLGRDCKLPEDLQEMRFSAAMRSSPFKRSGSRGGVVVPEAASARRFLHFDVRLRVCANLPTQSDLHASSPTPSTRMTAAPRPTMLPLATSTADRPR